ncbi:DUF3558 domain-containing protein [Saccharopolyspora sp. ASAGF58]|uniref:DUF3558 domain-containing protein n=1 Tax=Saccharopolyspora sp. ASAGF58 TaxID=2719023 RepID=UPI001445BA48|nr:DUF3558 domain-containing protein [Saccharopolyspora sp. ASAGF58]
MLRRATLTAASLLAVLGASACSPSGATNPPKTTTESASSTAATPKVENPKNLKAVTDACKLLAEEQVARLGGDAGAKPPEGSNSEEYGEPQCKWRNDAFNATIAINTKHGGLAEIQSFIESSDSFKPTQVGGYQGARVDEQSTLCRIELAVADDQSLEVNYFKNAGGTPEMNDPCGFAEKITSEALTNVPGA